MKSQRFAMIFAGFALASTLFAPLPGQAQTAGQDAHNAGADTRAAADNTGHAVKTGTKKTYHSTARTTHTAARKTTSGTRTGADKTKEGTTHVADKTKEGAVTGFDKTKEGTEKLFGDKHEPATAAHDKATERHITPKDMTMEEKQTFNESPPK